MAIQRIYGRLTLKSQQTSLPTQKSQIRVGVNEIRKLESNAQTLHVVAGRAWLTYQGEDHVLRRGDAFSLKKRGSAAVISPIDEQPLVYEVIETR